MTENKDFVRADRVPTNGEIELALERLSPNWARAAPRPRTGGISYILQSLAHGRSHAVVLEIKRLPRRLGDSSLRGGRRSKTDKSEH
jgi:hypothetical protein